MSQRLPSMYFTDASSTNSGHSLSGALLSLLMFAVLAVSSHGSLQDNPCTGIVAGAGSNLALECTATALCSDPTCEVQVVLPPPGATTTVELCKCADGPGAPCCQTILTYQDSSPPKATPIGSCDLGNGCGPDNCALRAFRVNETVFFSAKCFPSL